MQTVSTTFARFTPQSIVEKSKDHCADMFDDDYAHLTAPLNYPPACQWCGERGIHHPYCVEPLQSWEAAAPLINPAELHEAIQHDLRRMSNDSFASAKDCGATCNNTHPGITAWPASSVR